MIKKFICKGWIFFFLIVLISSAKTDPTTNPDQVKQKVGASSHIKTAQNSQTNNHYNDVEQNDSLFNEENNDGDMDMTEVDKVLLKEKTPGPSQNSEGKTNNKKSQSNSGNTAEETSQRYLIVILCEYCVYYDFII